VSPRGHLQATGRDARGRKQYRYHPEFRRRREQTKYERLASFARALPGIRRRIQADLRRPGLPREKVLATVVRLLERTFIRIGNESYARENGSYGLTTLRNRHVEVAGDRIRFQFRGKSRKQHAIELTDAQLARIIRRCRDLPGYELFEYVEEGKVRSVDSADVNAYLREITGEEYTAKDFRTWGGTLLTGLALEKRPAPTSISQAKREITEAIRATAKELGNTLAICRTCYVHPGILEAFAAGRLSKQRRIARAAGLGRPERRILAAIESA
jgi:DNA topoisomerase-1